VHVPLVPLREPERSTEIRRRRRDLPPDHRADPAFAANSNSWHTWRETEDDDYDEDCDALAYHNEEAKDDNDNFIACIFYEW
jgi:hypothetical protein